MQQLHDILRYPCIGRGLVREEGPFAIDRARDRAWLNEQRNSEFSTVYGRTSSFVEIEKMVRQ